jgi:hypothetical protein
MIKLSPRGTTTTPHHNRKAGAKPFHGAQEAQGTPIADAAFRIACKREQAHPRPLHARHTGNAGPDIASDDGTL